MSIERLQMAQMASAHAARMYEFSEGQLQVTSDVLWDLIVALELPPEATPEPPVLFGSWSAVRLLATVKELKDALQGPREAEGSTASLVRSDEGQRPEVPGSAGGEGSSQARPERSAYEHVGHPPGTWSVACGVCVRFGFAAPGIIPPEGRPGEGWGPNGERPGEWWERPANEGADRIEDTIEPSPIGPGG